MANRGNRERRRQIKNIKNNKKRIQGRENKIRREKRNAFSSSVRVGRDLDVNFSEEKIKRIKNNKKRNK